MTIMMILRLGCWMLLYYFFPYPLYFFPFSLEPSHVCLFP